MEQREDGHLFDARNEHHARGIGHDQVGAGHGAADDGLEDLHRAIVGAGQGVAWVRELLESADDRVSAGTVELPELAPEPRLQVEGSHADSK